jgi:hypothetical protein
MAGRLFGWPARAAYAARLTGRSRGRPALVSAT